MNSPKPSLDELRIERRPERPAASKTWLVILVIILLLSLAGGYAWRMRANVVEVHTAVAREIASGDKGQRTVLNASGYVTARRAATVSSKVTGKVVEVLIEEGMKVKEGQVLARLDETNIKSSLDVAEAQLESAKKSVEEIRAQLSQAESELQRTTQLRQQNIASASDLDNAEANAKALRARLKRQESDVTVAERQVAQWRQQLDDLIIRAPFGGIVTTKAAQPGEMISPVTAGGGFTRTGIGTIVDMDSLEIEIDVNESFINRVEPSQAVEATLDAYAGWKIPCKVIAIIPTADRQKATVKVRVGFDKLDSRILPEMAVKVAFYETGASAAVRAVTVPKRALKSQAGRDAVFVVRNGRAERRAVTISSVQNDEATLSAGVASGDAVVLDAPGELLDGMKVREAKP